MSNKHIKLYTEEQVAEAVMFGRWGGTTKKEYEDFLKKLTPIELPSDEEIHNEAFKQTRYSDSFIRGAKWLRDKIQGGNK